MTKIKLKDGATCGNVEVPSGEYAVVPKPGEQLICLVGGGKEFKLPCVKRPSKSRIKRRTVEIQFYSLGGTSWTLVADVPKMGEYVSFLTLGRSKD